MNIFLEPHNPRVGRKYVQGKDNHRLSINAFIMSVNKIIVSTCHILLLLG